MYVNVSEHFKSQESSVLDCHTYKKENSKNCFWLSNAYEKLSFNYTKESRITLSWNWEKFYEAYNWGCISSPKRVWAENNDAMSQIREPGEGGDLKIA